MSQRIITPAEYIAFTDILAQGIQILLDAKGIEETPATAAYYAADLRNTITAFALPDECEITLDLLPAASNLVAAMVLEGGLASLFYEFNAAVVSHIGTDLDTFLSDALLRVHNLWRRGGNLAIAAENVFPPVTILGTVAVTGSGAGTLTMDPDTDGAINTIYADAELEVKVINQQLGAAQIVLTVVGTNFLGGVETHTATITAEAAENAVFDVGTSGDRYYTLTSVTLTGGTNGDDLQIQSKVDRTL
jgi:hypothetical protein